MPERSPTNFDPTAVSEALHTPGQSTTDLAFGTGQRYDLTSGHLSLEVFPEHPLTRITAAAARVELFDTPPPQVVNDQVVIKRETAQEELSLTVSPEGTVVFGYVHHPATSAEPVTAPETVQEPLDEVPARTASPPARPTRTAPRSAPPEQPPPAVPDTAATPPPPNRHTDTAAKEQQPRLQLTGRLGRDPSFRTSPRGTLVGRFPLAVHQRDGTTTWHTILAFGDRAEQLQHRSETGELTKGQEVNLIGYQHTREQPTRDGGSKSVTEIYAVAVTRR